MNKQIEEMEIALREAQHELDKAWHECLQNKGKPPRREFIFISQYLVENAGYRKAFEVVEEIADFIWAKDIADTLLPINGRYLSKQDFITELKKKYEVTNK